MRRPVTISKMRRMISRSRQAYSMIEMAPSSRPVVASHRRWLAIRFSSMTITRMTRARGGASIPSNRSTARQ